MKNLEDCKTCGNNVAQIKQAFLDPLNRLGTMQEHECDDYGLYMHPEWLLTHYDKFGGTGAFALERERLLALAAIVPEYYI